MFYHNFIPDYGYCCVRSPISTVLHNTQAHLDCLQTFIILMRTHLELIKQNKPPPVITDLV